VSPVPPSRRGRRKARPRWGTRMATALSVLVLGAGGVGHTIISRLDDIGRIDPFRDIKNRPGDGRGMNVLLVGTDGRDRITPAEKATYHLGGAPCHCTDTVMILHVSADRSRVSVVSLPRDSYAVVPAHRDLVTGRERAAHPIKLNAAYAEGGPGLTVRTVEQMTHVKISHYVEVDFTSFMKTVDALGDLLCAWLFIYASQASRWASSELKATRGSCRLLVPVKTRNNTTSKGKLKTDPYNLYTRPGHHDAATKIAAFAGAKIFWVGDCRCEGENLFGLHGRCRQTALH
jgi:LCP family protein required for cell wall assembly